VCCTETGTVQSAGTRCSCSQLPAEERQKLTPKRKTQLLNHRVHRRVGGAVEAVASRGGRGCLKQAKHVTTSMGWVSGHGDAMNARTS
jgi:hypothetical protein